MGTGFCGALTTFSGFALETLLLGEEGACRAGAVNAAATVATELLAVWAGSALGAGLV